MRIVVFLDLDDTIFQTRPKCPADAEITPAARGRDGEALSFMTARQRALLTALSSSGIVIPTTARNHDAFRRVEWQFTHSAILDFGGVILQPDGRLDSEWDAKIRPLALAAKSQFRERLSQMEKLIKKHELGVQVRLVSDFDMPLYLVAKHPAADATMLEPIRQDLADSIDPAEFFLHTNGNNLSLVPSFLGKEKAVRHVLERHFGNEPVVTLGMGDSLTDAPFLAECDYSIVPQGSQLARSWIVR